MTEGDLEFVVTIMDRGLSSIGFGADVWTLLYCQFYLTKVSYDLVRTYVSVFMNKLLKRRKIILNKIRNYDLLNLLI